VLLHLVLGKKEQDSARQQSETDSRITGNRLEKPRFPPKEMKGILGFSPLFPDDLGNPIGYLRLHGGCQVFKTLNACRCNRWK
jgi:hypothetical protein